jgi:hypothetical protein
MKEEPMTTTNIVGLAEAIPERPTYVHWLIGQRIAEAERARKEQ